MTRSSPINKMVDDAMKCVKCDAPMGGCDCWDNPINPDAVAANIIFDMKSVYPDVMKAKSGGFLKTLRQVIIRRVSSHVEQNK